MAEQNGVQLGEVVHEHLHEGAQVCQEVTPWRWRKHGILERDSGLGKLQETSKWWEKVLEECSSSNGDKM